MAWVTNILLSVAVDDRSLVPEFSRWLEEDCPPRLPEQRWTGCGSLADLSGGEEPGWGGHKLPECSVYAGTVNNADLGAIVAKFGEIPWRRVYAAQLFVQDQEDSYFRVWMIRDGQPCQFAPLVPDEESDEFWAGPAPA
jgi:hypothetical protein